MKKMAILCVSLAMLFGAPSLTPAALTTFFGEELTPGGVVNPLQDPALARALFLSNLVGVGNEDFENFAAGKLVPITLSFPGTTGAIMADLTSGGASVRNSGFGPGRFNTSPGGIRYLETDGGQSFNIALSSPIAAFGFYGTDIGDFGGQVSLTATNGAVTNLVVPHTVGAPNAALLFFGFIDDAIEYDNILFSNSSGADFFGFDDMVIGDLEQVRPPPVIPEPSSVIVWSLIGLTFIGAGWWRRRKRTA